MSQGCRLIFIKNRSNALNNTGNYVLIVRIKALLKIEKNQFYKFLREFKVAIQRNAE